VICLAVVVTPYAARPALGDDARGAAELYGTYAPPPPSGRTAPMLPVSELAARAEAAVPGLVATWIRIAPYGDEAAHALVHGDRAGALGSRVRVRVRARDGAIVAIDDGGAPAQAVMTVLTGLHFAAYGGVGLRLIYVLLGIGGCMTILTGNWIWISRRRGNGALARLTVGVGAGVPLAIAAMLWANRLLPASDTRAATEAWTWFAALGSVVAGALLVPPTRRTWAALLGVAGAAFAAIPLLSALTRPAHLFNGGGALGWRVAGVDLGLAVLGALLGAIAAGLARRRPGSLR
jgi:uncharacterized iron-regulated membrane protein